MATDLQWDRTNLCPQTVSPPKLIANNTSGGRGIGNAAEQIIGNTPPTWALKLSGIPLNTPGRIRAWNVMKGLTQGRLVPFMAPLFDRNRGPSGASSVTIAGSYDPGTTAITFREYVGGAPVSPGMHFQVGERAYLVLTMDSGTPGGGYTEFPATISPPLREAVTNGTTLNFDDPWMRMRLATDDEMNNVDLDAKKFGVGEVNLVEDA